MVGEPHILQKSAKFRQKAQFCIVCKNYKNHQNTNKTEKAQKEAYYAEELQKRIKKKAEETAQRFRKEGPESYNLFNTIMGRYEKDINRNKFKEYFKK